MGGTRSVEAVAAASIGEAMSLRAASVNQIFGGVLNQTPK
jgi:hypothetical protein